MAYKACWQLLNVERKRVKTALFKSTHGTLNRTLVAIAPGPRRDVEKCKAEGGYHECDTIAVIACLMLMPILTEREQEVLDLMLKGHSDIDIANSLQATVITVHTHKHSIVNKLGNLWRGNLGGAEPTDGVRVPKQPYPGDAGAAEALPSDEATAQSKIP